MDPDPWNWSVQHVQEFFQNQAAGYISDMPHGRLPPPEPFLKSIADNDVDGATLLTAIDSGSLKDDCGIGSLGVRGAVLHCIVKLRRQSTIYSARNDPFTPQTPSSLPLAALQPSPAPQEAGCPPTANVGERVRPGETEVEDGRGRKRRKLDLSITNVLHSTNITGYLGDSAWPVDELFYGQTGFGQAIGPFTAIGAPQVIEADREAGLEDQNFQFVAHNKPFGETGYVYAHLRHFLQNAEEIALRRQGRDALGLLPYRAGAGLKARSATVLQFKNDGEEAVAIREDAAHLQSGYVPDGPAQPSAGEWEFLVDKHKGTQDDLLPIYGDSEDGNSEIATQTAAGDGVPEAEEESEEEISRDLIIEQASDVIENAIKEFVDEWNSQLPILESKRAWTVWKKMRQSRTLREGLIQNAHARIEHLTARLNKMKSEMLEYSWPNEHKLQDACGTLEPTVQDREEQRWMISIWKRRQEPTHVVRHQSTKAKASVHTHASGTGGRGLRIDPGDRFSFSPAPVAQEDKTKSPSEEIQYDADDEVFHTPVTTPENILAADVASGNNTDDMLDFIVDNYDDAISVKDEEDDRDLRGGQNANETISSGKDETYMPESAASESEELPSPSTFVRPGRPKQATRPSVAPIDLTLSSDSSDIKSRRGRPPKVPTKVEIIPKGEPTNATAEEVDTWQYSALVRNNDRQRILIRLLRDEGEDFRNRLAELVRARATFKYQLQAAVQSARRNTNEPTLREDTLDTMVLAATIYLQWAMPAVTEGGARTLDETSWTSIANPVQYGLFSEMLSKILIKKDSRLFVHKSDASKSGTAKSGTAKSGGSKFNSSSNPHVVSDDDNNAGLTSTRTPHKKRKRDVDRSMAAQNSRASALSRQKRYDESQTTNSAQLVQMIASDPSYSSVEINPSKNETDEFIYIRDRIAKKMKAHQIDGTRFLWREITAYGEGGGQGCVLAHTMGLGKTMQTIALLVALNEAAQSTDKKVCNQLPPHLLPKGLHGPHGTRQLRMLILAPPGLLQNWHREIYRWAKDQFQTVLILDSANKALHMRHLREWMRMGGILLIGYQMFRSMLAGQLRKADQEKQEARAEEIVQFEKLLLRGPEVVVADEAHNLKNDQSEIAQLASRIKTESRIALTGTPMSNDVGEIYALVSWVAPGFLGDPQEFRAHFTEPIEEGLYADSSPYEQRRSIKKLKVLQAEIGPKVNRANIEVLRGSLKPKIEYVITVPLGTVQTGLYKRYIKALLKGDRSENASQVTLFGWLSVLTLLVNHPRCFRQKLLAPPPPPKKKRNQEEETESRERTPSTATESGSVTPMPYNATALDGFVDGTTTPDIIDEEALPVPALDSAEIEEILDGFEDTLDPSLSAKVSVFLELLDLALGCKDKVLVFSSSIPTLDYLAELLKERGDEIGRIDGRITVSKRTEYLEKFHNDEFQIMLVSTKAGGVGLNIQDANRVFIFDFGFNPTLEEQAIGRAYRLGQQKPVYVYRFVTGGSFEMNIYNKQLFKTSLASRVVDKKNPRRNAERNARDYLYEPRAVPQEDVNEWKGKDPQVLDRFLEERVVEDQGLVDPWIRAIKTMETLQEEAMDAPLNEEEQKEVELEIEQSRKRPRGKKALMAEQAAQLAAAAQQYQRPNSLIVSFPANRTAVQQQPPSTMAGAIVNRETPHAHPAMGGLPTTYPSTHG